MSNTGTGLQVAAISGSPSETSKTARLMDLILQRLEGGALRATHHRVASVAPEVLFRGVTRDPVLAGMIAAVEGAHGIIIATPIYKASYSGLLKCFLDVLPQFALAGKAVLPIGTGGSIAHVLALDYALRPVLQSMGARHIVQSHFVAEAAMRVEAGQMVLDEQAAAPLWTAVAHFEGALTDHPDSRMLGHPRPGL